MESSHPHFLLALEGSPARALQNAEAGGSRRKGQQAHLRYGSSTPLQSAILTATGEHWNESRRRALKERLDAGGLASLEFKAVVFRTGRNANHVRFRVDELAGFAASFVGLPFLRNHDTADIGARDGIVLASRLVGPALLDLVRDATGQGIWEFHQHIRLTTQRGMRDFLEGVIDRFSIGWNYAGVECSICGQDWFACGHWPGRRYPVEPQGPTRNEVAQTALCELVFLEPSGKETSAVNAPAVPGTHIIEELCQLKEARVTMHSMTDKAPDMTTDKTILLPNGEMHTVSAPEGVATRLASQIQQLQAQLEQQRVDALIDGAGLSPASRDTVRLAGQGRDATFVGQLIEAQRRAESAAARPLVQGLRPVTAGSMQTPEDRLQTALHWLFGVRDEPTPPPSLRSLGDLYQAITGDHNWYGVFNPEWSQLAAANTTTLAGMVVNSLNKVVKMHYDNLITYRWYEAIVDVVPHDGSTHPVDLLMVDGLASLPSVNEGAAYTEATVGDSKESMSFTKRGHYVGITLEAIRRSDIQRIQAIPREMVKAGIRTRSAAIAAIFTSACGVGPTLAEDSKALFHADHGNLDTAALSEAEWAKARQRIWGQTVPGTSSPLALWPTFCLAPIELYDSALGLFGYGSGDVGKPNSAGTAQVVNPYADARPGDPRPIPIAVPEFTDGADWAYIVDPRLHPVIHMAYANAPQGGSHPLPEIFQVTSETSGLMFTNDTLPVKIRDWWGYGVSTYVGVGKNNVAG